MLTLHLMDSKTDLKSPPLPSKPLTTAIIGLGDRGSSYASFAKNYSEWLKVVAICDIDGVRCQSYAKEYNISPENVIEGDWSLLASRPRLADSVIICTQDKDYVGPAVALANLGYNILLEKPMAVTMEDCVKIYNAYVRGNWHNEDQSAFALLTKSCHDLDLLADMMGTKCKRISSFGSLTFFKKENKPKEAGKTLNCLDCTYEKKCPYSAKRIYLDSFKNLKYNGWPISIVQPHGEIDSENLTAALRKGNYGRCVYEMDNDVCDQQVVNMEFENGSTASFSMIAFTEVDHSRRIKIFGTKGELEGNGVNEITVYDFLTRKKKVTKPLDEPYSKLSFIQFGEDKLSIYELAQSFIFACLTGNQNYILSGPKETLESHLYVFAAEHARRSGTVVDIDEFRKQFVIKEPNELPKEQ